MPARSRQDSALIGWLSRPQLISWGSVSREHQLPEAWVIAVPASIGMLQALGRMLLYCFEHRLDIHQANRRIPGLIPLSLLTPLAAAPLVLGLLALVQAQRLTAHHRLIDVFYVHDALPFRLSLSKPFDRL